MKSVVLVLSLALLIVAAPRVHAQASAIPAATPTAPAGENSDQQGRKLLDQMVEALGGDAWRARKDIVESGRTSAFFHGQPNGNNIEYTYYHRYNPEAERYGFLTDRSMILPGKKTDVVQVWTADNGYEVTYKGRTTLPKEQVEDYMRRRAHSIESVVNVWLKAPGVMVVYEGRSMVERSQADKVTILAADNDAVTIDLDANTHLPLRRTFQWRNTTFKDHDEDAEEYDAYHTIQGLPTPFTISRYRDGDLANQHFFTKVEYNTNLSSELFDPDKLLEKKK
jgi:hypothetical protein